MGCVLSDYVPNSTSVNRLIALKRAAASFCCVFLSLGNGIVTAAAVWVAAEYSPKCQARADEKSPFRICLDCILGASGTKSAGRLSLEL